MYLKHFPSMMIESTYNTQYGYHHLKISADTSTMCFVEGMMFTCYYIARIYGLVHNQTDFILLPKCSQTSINKDKQRIYPGDDAGSNRDLVLPDWIEKWSATQIFPEFALIWENAVEVFKAIAGGSSPHQILWTLM